MFVCCVYVAVCLLVQLTAMTTTNERNERASSGSNNRRASLWRRFCDYNAGAQALARA